MNIRRLFWRNIFSLLYFIWLFNICFKQSNCEVICLISYLKVSSCIDKIKVPSDHLDTKIYLRIKIHSDNSFVSFSSFSIIAKSESLMVICIFTVLRQNNSCVCSIACASSWLSSFTPDRISVHNTQLAVLLALFFCFVRFFYAFAFLHTGLVCYNCVNPSWLLAFLFTETCDFHEWRFITHFV